VLTAYTLSALLGYLIGSFPTAFLLVKWKAGIDIRRAGSGNVGTLNTMEVTGSRSLGVAVLVIDVVKGALAVALTMSLFGNLFWTMGVAGLSAIAGHAFPVWLNFRGGRGLAAAAGVFMVLGWIFIVIWLVLWTAAYLPFRNVHLGNVLASLAGAGVVAGLPKSALTQTLPNFTSTGNLLFLTITFCVLVLITHREPIAAMMKRARSL